MVAEAAYQEYEEPDDIRKMANYEHMKAIEGVIRQQFSLRMKLRIDIVIITIIITALSLATNID